MMEFKSKADEIIRARWGIQVEHICAQRKKMDGSGEMEKVTYETLFYHVPNRKGGERETAQDKRYTQGTICGFLRQLRACTSSLKQRPIKRLLGMASHHQQLLQKAQNPVCTDSPTQSGAGVTGSRRGATCQFSSQRPAQGAKINIVQYLGIAADEPERIARHTKQDVLLPLVEAGLKESDCRKWCEDNGLLSPIYTTMNRGGCWFCHYQGVQALRSLRKTYPEYWALMLKWDQDSPGPFKPDGHTVHDYELRFSLEEAGKVPTDRTFRWKMLKDAEKD